MSVKPSNYFRLVAERIAEKQINGMADRLAIELQESAKRARSSLRRETREAMYSLGRVDNAARRFLLAFAYSDIPIEHREALRPHIEHLEMALAKNYAVETPYPLSLVGEVSS